MLDALRAHPLLTLEELQAVRTNHADYGSANNVVEYFEEERSRETNESHFPIDSVRADVLSGQLPRDAKRKYFYFLIKEGILFEAFSKIGNRRTRQFFEEQLVIFDRAEEWSVQNDIPKTYGRTRAVAPINGNGYLTPLDELTGISEQDRKAYAEMYLRRENWYREAILALVDAGANFNALYGSGNPFIMPSDL